MYVRSSLTGVIVGVIVYYVSKGSGEASMVYTQEGSCGEVNAPMDMYLHLTYEDFGEHTANVTFLYIRDSVVGQVQARSRDFGAKVSRARWFPLSSPWLLLHLDEAHVN